MIWEQYHSSISIAGRKKFEDFNQVSTETFYRLKLQSIEERLVQNGGGEDHL
jgi:hypothetical protein